MAVQMRASKKKRYTAEERKGLSHFRTRIQGDGLALVDAVLSGKTLEDKDQPYQKIIKGYILWAFDKGVKN